MSPSPTKRRPSRLSISRQKLIKDKQTLNSHFQREFAKFNPSNTPKSIELLKNSCTFICDRISDTENSPSDLEDEPSDCDLHHPDQITAVSPSKNKRNNNNKDKRRLILIDFTNRANSRIIRTSKYNNLNEADHIIKKQQTTKPSFATNNNNFITPSNPAAAPPVNTKNGASILADSINSSKPIVVDRIDKVSEYSRSLDGVEYFTPSLPLSVIPFSATTKIRTSPDLHDSPYNCNQSDSLENTPSTSFMPLVNNNSNKSPSSKRVTITSASSSTVSLASSSPKSRLQSNQPQLNASLHVRNRLQSCYSDAVVSGLFVSHAMLNVNDGDIQKVLKSDKTQVLLRNFHESWLNWKGDMALMQRTLLAKTPNLLKKRADAIINQQQQSKKSLQVLLLGGIFREACQIARQLCGNGVSRVVFLIAFKDQKEFKIIADSPSAAGDHSLASTSPVHQRSVVSISAESNEDISCTKFRIDLAGACVERNLPVIWHSSLEQNSAEPGTPVENVKTEPSNLISIPVSIPLTFLESSSASSSSPSGRSRTGSAAGGSSDLVVLQILDLWPAPTNDTRRALMILANIIESVVSQIFSSLNSIQGSNVNNNNNNLSDKDSGGLVPVIGLNDTHHPDSGSSMCQPIGKVFSDKVVVNSSSSTIDEAFSSSMMPLFNELRELHLASQHSRFSLSSLVDTNALGLITPPVDAMAFHPPLFDPLVDKDAGDIRTDGKLLLSWDFNPFEYSQRRLANICVSYLTHCEGTFTPFGSSLRDGYLNKVYQLVHATRELYMDNFYHGFAHGVSVMGVVALFLQKTDARRIVNKVEGFAALIAGLLHDIGHPGLNNDYINENAKNLPVIYPRSVLENMHTAIAMQLLERYGIFDEFILGAADTPKEQEEARAARNLFRNSVVRGILATDMSLHKGYVDTLTSSTIKDVLGSDGTVVPYCMTRSGITVEHMVKAGDLSNPILRTDLCIQWAKRIVSEFSIQYHLELDVNGRGSPSGIALIKDPHSEVALANSQIGFGRFCVLPYWKDLDGVFGGLSDRVAQAEANIKYWTNKLEEAQKKKQQEETSKK